jgi:hypothetical protein
MEMLALFHYSIMKKNYMLHVKQCTYQIQIEGISVTQTWSAIRILYRQCTSKALYWCACWLGT